MSSFWMLWLERSVEEIRKAYRRDLSMVVAWLRIIAEKRLRRRRLMIYKRCWLNGWRRIQSDQLRTPVKLCGASSSICTVKVS
ncbi:hypothetical protein KCP74_10070 [Salmonella enterica subsp. enterica]|nr:hypothetical protein KCP74_10070 [Salmonella enterica subsp. enterica]